MKTTRVFGKISFNNEMNKEELGKVKKQALLNHADLSIHLEKITREMNQMKDAVAEIEKLESGISFREAVSLKLGVKESKMPASKPTFQGLFVQDHGWQVPTYDVPAGERLYVWLHDGPEVRTSQGPFRVPMVDENSFTGEDSLDKCLELFLWGACTAKDEYACYTQRDKDCKYDVMLVGPGVREELHFAGRIFKTICLPRLKGGQDFFVIPSSEYFGYMPHIKDTIGWFCMLDSIVKLNASEVESLKLETGKANELQND